MLMASSLSIIACTNGIDSKPSGTEIHSKKTEHSQKDSMTNTIDSMGMRMGGNELDSKKK